MDDTSRFGCEINQKILEKFREKVNKDYYRGKIRELIEKFMEEYIKR